jgi:hypothetical protein
MSIRHTTSPEPPWAGEARVVTRPLGTWVRRLSASRMMVLAAGPPARAGVWVTVMAGSPNMDNMVVENVNQVVDRVN